MTPGRALLAALCAVHGAGACTDTRSIDLTLLPSTRAVLLFQHEPGATHPTGSAYTSDALRAVSVRAGADATLFEFASSLEEMTLPVGVVAFFMPPPPERGGGRRELACGKSEDARTPAGGGTRGLPGLLRAQRLEADGAAFDPVELGSLADRVPKEVLAFPASPFDVVGCIGSGGCIEQLEQGGGAAPTFFCKRPCNVPSPAQPAAPRAVVCPRASAVAVDETVDPSNGCTGPAFRTLAGPHEPCGAAEPHVVGEDGCRRIGAACLAAGTWRAAPPGARPFYVLAGATGGDGSQDRPFGSLQEATASARSGDAILLGAGEYPWQPASFPSGVEVIGACVEATTINGEVPLSSSLSFRDLTISGGLVVSRGADVRASSVHLHGGNGFGSIVGEGGSLFVEDARISGASGLYVGRGGVAALRRTAIDAADRGVDALEARRVHLDRVALTRASTAVSLVGTASATLDMIAVRTHGAGFVLGQTDARLKDVYVDCSLMPSRRTTAIAATDATLELTRVRVVNATGRAMALRGGRVDGSDLSVDMTVDQGIAVVRAGAAVLERVHVRGSSGVGIELSDLPEGVLRDAVVEDIRHDPAQVAVHGGVGVFLSRSGARTIERVRVARAHSDGVLVTELAGNLVSSDLDIEMGGSGTGVSVLGTHSPDPEITALSRVRVRGGKSGVQLEAAAQISDLDVSASREAFVALPSLRPASISRFRLDGSDVGLIIRRSSTGLAVIQLREGHVTGPTALATPACSFPRLTPGLVRVGFAAPNGDAPELVAEVE